MLTNVNAEIISIGTEILLGELTDTNSVFIARTFRDLGINIYFMTSVGDNESRIVNAIQLGMSRAQIVITCGGLGPTIDDMTRQSVATATERGLTFHQNLYDQIAERFAGFRVKMTENNRRQAFLPDDAVVIENPVGTAPSFIVEHGENIVISLPGVPREMKFLLQEKVVPYLQQKYQLGIIKARTLKTAGIGESTLDDLLGDALLNSGNPSIGLAAHSGQIDVRITAKADNESLALQMIEKMELSIRERAGQFIYGADEDRLENVFVDTLAQNQLTIAIVEAGFSTGIVETIRKVNADILALSETYGIIDDFYTAYSVDNTTSIRDLSTHVAQKIQAETGVVAVIVIISDPNLDEASDNVEGTVVTVQSADDVRTRVYGFGGKSELARLWVSSWSISAAWQMVRGLYASK
ncbi:MAG: CinA family nicotinamide mononucleotide deamidase-related protein [Aggregatilineales bacterium]